MKRIALVLQPYKELVGAAAGVVTIGQFLSGVFLCKDIYKNKSTVGIPSMPFIGGLVIGILMLKYSIMLDDIAMLVVNTASIVLNLLYTLFYFIYSQDKNVEIYKPLAYGCALVAILFGYIGWEDPALVEYRYGLIITTLLLVLIGSPLVELGDILKTKDASRIPFPITFSGAICALLWLIYGIILLNEFMVFQNLVGFALCGLQLALWFKYPKKEQPDKKKL